MDFSYHFSVLSWLHNDSLFKSNLQSWILKGWFHQSLYRLSKWFKVFFEWQSRHKYQLPPQYCYYYVTQRVSWSSELPLCHFLHFLFITCLIFSFLFKWCIVCCCHIATLSCDYWRAVVIICWLRWVAVRPVEVDRTDAHYFICPIKSQFM